MIILLVLCFAAEFLSSVQRHSEAVEQRVYAAELAPNDYSMVVAAATALRLADRKAEAERWYRWVNIHSFCIAKQSCVAFLKCVLNICSVYFVSRLDTLKWRF